MDCIDVVWEKEALNGLKMERLECDIDIIRFGDVRFFREDDFFGLVYVCVCVVSGIFGKKQIISN